MAVIVALVEDVVEVLVDITEAVWDAIVDTTTYLWDEVIAPALEWIAARLGFTEEQVVATEVVTTKLMDPLDPASNQYVKLALEHGQTNQSIISIMTGQTNDIVAKYRGAYGYGVNTYSKGLPTTNIKSNAVNLSEAKLAVDDSLTVDSTVVSALKGLPTKEEAASYYLRASNNYNYLSGRPRLTTTSTAYGDTTEFDVVAIDYNATNANYDITVDRDIEVTTTITVVTNATDSTLEDVTTDIVKVELISNTTVYTSTTTVTEAAGTTAASVTVTYEVDTEQLVFADPGLNVHVKVKYHLGDPNDYIYWIYDTTLGLYPTLNNTTNGSMAQFMPAIIMRNNGVDVNSDKSTLWYKETDELLGLIGLSVDTLVDGYTDSSGSTDNVVDVIVNYAINTNDDTPEINKVMYETFSEMYLNSGLIETDPTVVSQPVYTAIVEEDPYNIAISWNDQTRTVVTGTIGTGDVGTYEKVVDATTNTLILRKQETITSYIEYKFVGMVGFTLITGTDPVGGGTIKNSHIKELSDPDGLELPLAMFVLNSLTPVEASKLYPWTLKMSMYAAVVQYLEWYQTSKFLGFLKFVLIVIVVVSIIVTFGAAATFWGGVAAVVGLLLTGYVVSLVITEILKSNAPKWLKVVLVLAVIGIGAYTGSIISGTEFISADTLLRSVNMLSDAVQTWSDIEVSKIQANSDILNSAVDTRLSAMEETANSLTGGLSVTDIIGLNQLSPPPPPVISISTMYDMAKGSMMTNYDALYILPNQIFMDNLLPKVEMI